MNAICEWKYHRVVDCVGVTVVYLGNTHLDGPFLIVTIFIKNKIKAIFSTKSNSKGHH